MYLQKVYKQINLGEKNIFVGILNVTDEKSRTWSRIRIRIRTKMLPIHNTGFLKLILSMVQDRYLCLKS